MKAGAGIHLGRNYTAVLIAVLLSLLLYSAALATMEPLLPLGEFQLDPLKETIEAGNYDFARFWLNPWLQDCPSWGVLYLYSAEISIRTEQYKLAIDEYVTAIELGDTQSSFGDAAAALVLALSYEQPDDYSRVIKALQQYIDITPGDPNDTHSMVQCTIAELQREWSTTLGDRLSFLAQQYYDHARSLPGLFARRYDPYHGLTAAEVESGFRHIVPNDMPAALRSCVIGFYYQQEGQIEQAITELEKAIELDANYASAYYFLGFAYQDNEQWSEAVKALQKYIQLTPDDPNENHDIVRCVIQELQSATSVDMLLQIAN